MTNDELRKQYEEEHDAPAMFHKVKQHDIEYISYGQNYAKWLEHKVIELLERQSWIDEVSRPMHPDDERPWCSSYLDAMAEIKRLKSAHDDAR